MKQDPPDDRAALVSIAPGQQFVQAVGALPGPAVWSEGVCAADVDRDGDLDLLFANGDGFDSPGTKRQSVLVINQLVQLGTPTFVDESVLRFGVHVSHATMVIAGDVDGDGWVDVLFANAFNTDPPSLYINRGAAQPGRTRAPRLGQAVSGFRGRGRSPRIPAWLAPAERFASTSTPP